MSVPDATHHCGPAGQWQALEVQEVTAIHGAAQAQVVGPALGNIVVMVHCESQNMGHQMGTKFLCCSAAAKGCVLAHNTAAMFAVQCDAFQNHQPTPSQTMSVLFEEIEQIPVNGLMLEGLLALPPGTKGVVLFAHGSGSSRHSPRNKFVAQVLCDHGLGTLLMDLLSPAEDQEPAVRFGIELLTDRLVAATLWLHHQRLTRHLPLGYFGASTGAAAALRAAAHLGPLVQAVVSRGGRADLAGLSELQRVSCPTLFLVGGLDTEVLRLNRQVARLMLSLERSEPLPEVRLTVVPGATHLFEEPGTLEAVARHAAQWFEQHLHVRH